MGGGEGLLMGAAAVTTRLTWAAAQDSGRSLQDGRLSVLWPRHLGTVQWAPGTEWASVAKV